MDAMIRSNPKAAAVKIENYYICYRNKQLFKLLKLTISAAELSLTNDLLRKISPMESDFFKNERFLKMKIKFRFGGSEFPPGVYYKIFNNSTICIKNDQKLFPSESQSVSSGNQYSGYIDELPAKYGGKNNPWKKLDQSVLVRRCFIHNLIDFVDSKKASLMLKSFMFQEFLVSNLDLSVATLTNQKINSINRHSLPKSHKSRAKNIKNKRYNWKIPDCEATMNADFMTDNDFECSKANLKNSLNLVAFPINDADWEDEALVLYEWTRNLSNAHV